MRKKTTTIGRPKLLQPENKRVHFSCTVDPRTKKTLEALRSPDKSIGRVLDDLLGTTQ